MRPLAALGARKKAEAQAAKAKSERAALPDGGVRTFLPAAACPRLTVTSG
jgi:hypothetical protein